jgi:NADPH:quinone reductase-like Zn-dependent oxidoreductase
MKAIRFSRYGGPDVLELVDIACPHPGPDQVRIRVQAAGVNGIDWKIRAGLMREMMDLTLPAGTGRDAAGLVDEIGDGVSGLALGDAVFGTGRDTLAEYAVLDAWAAKPERLSFAEAAGFPVPVETAIRILKQVGIQPEQTLLVSGASGGVGSATVQIEEVSGAPELTGQPEFRRPGNRPTTPSSSRCPPTPRPRGHQRAACSLTSTRNPRPKEWKGGWATASDLGYRAPDHP